MQSAIVRSLIPATTFVKELKRYLCPNSLFPEANRRNPAEALPNFRWQRIPASANEQLKAEWSTQNCEPDSGICRSELSCGIKKSFSFNDSALTVDYGPRDKRRQTFV